MEGVRLYFIAFLILKVAVSNSRSDDHLHPPTMLEVKTLNTTALLVSWCPSVEDTVTEPPERCFKMTSFNTDFSSSSTTSYTISPTPQDVMYTVVYESEGSPLSNDTDVQGSSTTINELSPCTLYEVYVIAFNNIGMMSNESEAASNHTAKLSKVTNLQAEKQEDGLFVSWEHDTIEGVIFEVTLDGILIDKTPDKNITISHYPSSSKFEVCVAATLGECSSGDTCKDYSDKKNLALLLGLGLGLPAALFLIGVVVFLVRRRRQSSGNPRTGNSRGVDNMSMRYEGGMSVPPAPSTSIEQITSFTNLANQGPSVISNDNEMRHINEKTEKLLRNEFTKKFMNQKPSDASTVMSNNHKKMNRYTNIAPYDRTLVTIKHVEYINASYIMDKKFIATQDPWPNQDDELWQMIWECNVRIIIRLSNDNAAHPTAHYIRDEIGGNWVMGVEDEITVSVKDIQKDQCFHKRIVVITKDSESRVIEHYHMPHWPEGGVPSASDVLQLVTQARSAANKYLTGSGVPQPILVHCSAGVGRTGTVIALWCMIDDYEQNKTPNIVRTIEALRKDRMGMVQTEDQYICIYESMEQFSNASGRRQQQQPQVQYEQL